MGSAAPHPHMAALFGSVSEALNHLTTAVTERQIAESQAPVSPTMLRARDPESRSEFLTPSASPRRRSVRPATNLGVLNTAWARPATADGDVRSLSRQIARRWGTPITHAQLVAYLRPERARASAQQRFASDHRWKEAQMHDWLEKHNGPQYMPRVEISAERREAIRETFEMLDADSSGTIDFNELATAMRALGFGADAIHEAIELGDYDGNGVLDFDEFVGLILQASAKRGTQAPSADCFPFSLVVNSHRISRLVDSYSPARREASLGLSALSDSNLAGGVLSASSASPAPTASPHDTGRAPRHPPVTAPSRALPPLAHAPAAAHRPLAAPRRAPLSAPGSARGAPRVACDASWHRPLPPAPASARGRRRGV